MKENVTNGSKEKIPQKMNFLFSIPIILLAGWFTCGIGAVVLLVVRIIKYPNKRVGAIIVLAIVLILAIAMYALISYAQDPSNADALNNSILGSFFKWMQAELAE